jgi:hypothetical protein
MDALMRSKNPTRDDVTSHDLLNDTGRDAVMAGIRDRIGRHLP